MTLKSLQWNNDFEKFLVVGGWWVVGVSVIIASALVILRQELRPVVENSLGQWPGPGPELDN